MGHIIMYTGEREKGGESRGNYSGGIWLENQNLLKGRRRNGGGIKKEKQKSLLHNYLKWHENCCPIALPSIVSGTCTASVHMVRIDSYDYFPHEFTPWGAHYV